MNAIDSRREPATLSKESPAHGGRDRRKPAHNDRSTEPTKSEPSQPSGTVAVGLAGRVIAARDYAEREGVDATARQLCGVAWVSWDGDRDIADVFAEVLDQ